MAVSFFSDNYGDGAAMELGGRCHTLEIGDSQAANTLDNLAYDAWPRAWPLLYDYMVIPGSNSGQTLGNNLGTASPGLLSKDIDVALNPGDANYDIPATATTITAVTSGATTTFTTGSTAHGIVSGETVPIVGTYTGLTGWTNGSYVATVTAYNTFTVPVATSGSATPTATPTVTTPARTGFSTRVMGPMRLTFFPSSAASDTASLANGIMLPRQISSNVSPHANSNRNAPHPTLARNSGKPWYHGSYMKGKYVIWYGPNTLEKFAIFAFRQGNSGSSTTTASTRTQVDLSGTVFPDSSEGPISTGWTPPVNDQSTAVDGAGYYDLLTPGVGSVGIVDDHELAIRSYTSSAAYAEAGEALMPICAVFARCNNSGVMFDGRSYGCGYDVLGRSGSTVTSWLNYCTQTDWQYYFAATVLVPDGRVKLRLRFGHNLETTNIDANIGDGSVKEYDSGASDKLANWKVRYIAFIDRLKEAFATAVTTGQLPAASRLYIELEVPWKSHQSSKTAEIPTEINAAVKAVAVATGSSWFSYIDYWSSQAPFWTLHAYTPAQGQMLAMARLDAMHRATNQAYTVAGPVLESRQFRGSVRV